MGGWGGASEVLSLGKRGEGEGSFSYIEGVVLTQELQVLAILEGGGAIGFCPIKYGGGGSKKICPVLMTSP